MVPGMTYCIDMTDRLHGRQAEVYVASSFAEYDRLQIEGVAVEMLIADPVFRLE